MRPSARHQQGMTIVEVAIVCSLLLIMVALILPGFTAMHQDDLDDQCLAELQHLREAARRYWGQVQTSTQAANGTWSYTYVSAADSNGNPITLAKFDQQVGDTLVQNNPWGTPYNILISDTSSYVETTVPTTGHDFYPATYVDNGNGTGTVTLNIAHSFSAPTLPARESLKFDEYEEVRR